MVQKQNNELNTLIPHDKTQSASNGMNIAIVGRTNVGKSTLFNRLIEKNKAIVSNVAGTTRDKNFGVLLWRGQSIQMVDTGGVDIESLKKSIEALASKKPFKASDSIEKQIIIQTQSAIRQADLLLFVTDVKTGMMPQDRQLAAILKKINKPTIVVANKADRKKMAENASELYKLGMGDPVAISAKNGSGVGDLLDIIFEKYNPGPSVAEIESPSTKVAIIGKPNAGKSSLLNALVGQTRVIVSEIPQTTREPQDIFFKFKDLIIQFIDTAGLKRKVKIARGIDQVASKRTLHTIKNAEIVLFTIEAQKRITKQDQALARLIVENASGVIIVANKVDLLEGFDSALQKKITQHIYDILPHLSWSPVIFTSAETGQNVKKILQLIADVAHSKEKIISQTQLDEFLQKAVLKKKPHGGIGAERPRIKLLEQDQHMPHEFYLYIGKKQKLHESYRRYIKNSMRKEFQLEGVNINIIIKQK